MPKDKSSGKKLADMMYGNPEGAAFGVFPQMKGKRSRQDPEAAKNFPVDLARGLVAGAVGMPGDIESLARLPYELITGNESPTILPTSEDVLKRIPFGSDTPAGQFASGLGTLAGGSANIGAAPRMVKKGALAAGRAGERMAERVVPQIMERGGAGADILSGLAQGSRSHIFIGPKAKTFHQGRADMAVAMEEAGRTPQEIWLATGTFRGADGIWRQEIDDRAAKFLMSDERQERVDAVKQKIAEMQEQIKRTPQKDLFPKALTEAKKEVRDDIDILKGEVRGRSKNPRTQGLQAQFIFEHPELYKAYPELQNVNIVTEGSGGAGTRGALSIIPSHGQIPGKMEMDVYDRGLLENPTSTTLHEMQHAVQTLEGMGPGGNPTFAFTDPKASEMLQQERLKMLNPLPYEDFVRQGGYTDMEQAGKDYAKYTKDLQGGIDPAYDRMLQQRVAMEYYKRLAGEAEARAVQDRQMMTPAQRMETPPPASYDVPQEDLIVKPPREYADGGRVHISDNPDVMQLEMAGGGLVRKGIKAAAKAAKAGADAPIVEAPSIIIPSKIQNVREAVRKSEGNYGAKRVERAADEIRNLERMYTEKALRDAFTGDNAKAVVTMNPADFEKYANILIGRTQEDIGPRMRELGKMGDINKHTVPTEEYIQHLMRVQGGFDQVPYLNLYKDEVGLPIKPEVRGHEGRHRSRALTEAGEPSALVEINPRGDLREGLPRRSQEEYIEALREELGLSRSLVLPQTDGTSRRPAIILPEPYAEGGKVNMAAGGVAKLARLARAPAKSKQEIQAIAERIAPQVTGEYVRESAKSAKTVAGKTQKQFQREKTLPVDVRPTDKERIPQPVDIEKLKGDVMIGIPGDPTLAGKTLYGFGDVRLGSPSPQHGGPLYGLYNDENFWASGLGAARRVQNLAKEAGEQYDAPVAGKYIMMGPDSINYAQHFADANLQAIDLDKMTKKQVEQFNKLIRFGNPKSGPRPSFPGIEDKESAYLHLAMDPELRKHFNELMQKPTVTETLNLPSGTDIRFAITEPALRDLETGVTGFSIGRMRPEISSKDLPLSTHPTYSHDIPGEFMGQSKYPIPYELSFPDTLKSIRENPAQAPHEFGSLKMVGPRQTIDQQMIDEIKAYEERMKQLTGRKKGGAVTKDEQSVQNPVHFTENPDAMRLALSKRN